MENSTIHAVSILSDNTTGVLRDISEAMASNGANIVMAQASVLPSRGSSFLYFEYEGIVEEEKLIRELNGLPSVHEVVTYRRFTESV